MNPIRREVLNGLFVLVISTLHRSPPPRRGREALILELYQTCSRTLRSVATIQGARRASGQTNPRAASTKKPPTSVPAAWCAHSYQVSSIRVRQAHEN